MGNKVTAKDLALEERIKAMMATQPAIEKGEQVIIPEEEEITEAEAGREAEPAPTSSQARTPKSGQEHEHAPNRHSGAASGHGQSRPTGQEDEQKPQPARRSEAASEPRPGSASAHRSGMELHDESASEQYAPPEMDDDASLTADESPESPRNTTKGGRRRKDSPDYRSMFLVSSPSRIRFQTYISQEVYDKVKVFLPVIAPNTSITSFINNVLNHHMMQYQEEINSLYFKHLSKKPVDYEKD